MMNQDARIGLYSSVASRGERGVDAVEVVAGQGDRTSGREILALSGRYIIRIPMLCKQILLVAANAALLPLAVYGVYLASGEKATLVKELLAYDGMEAAYWNAFILLLAIGTLIMLPSVKLSSRRFAPRTIQSTGTDATGSEDYFTLGSESPIDGLKGN